jgi:hypothetical protein
MKLNDKDYKKILKFYKLQIPKNKYTMRSIAEDKLAEKLCKCIKKVKRKEDKNEGRATAICRKSVIMNKGYKNFGFTCKKKYSLRNKKNRSYKLVKNILNNENIINNANIKKKNRTKKRTKK